MKDFDSERIEAWRERQSQDRTFLVGGETFTYLVAVPPEALIPWVSLAEAPDEARAVELLDESVLAFLEPDQEEQWARVRKEAVPPLTAEFLGDLIRWLIAEQVGRPTGTPSASTPGRQTAESGKTSKGDSSSPPAVKAA